MYREDYRISGISCTDSVPGFVSQFTYKVLHFYTVNFRLAVMRNRESLYKQKLATITRHFIFIVYDVKTTFEYTIPGFCCTGRNDL